ncbi:MAG: hypothetical protein JWP06_235 [Candidatus Saccharibacteria bacterium]|nr:hypothetical protein [Candidatus Saccharibacteria bacterium]
MPVGFADVAIELPLRRAFPLDLLHVLHCQADELVVSAHAYSDSIGDYASAVHHTNHARSETAQLSRVRVPQPGQADERQVIELQRVRCTKFHYDLLDTVG